MIEEEAVEVLLIGVSTAKCTKLVVSACVCMSVSKGVCVCVLVCLWRGGSLADWRFYSKMHKASGECMCVSG